MANIKAVSNNDRNAIRRALHRLPDIATLGDETGAVAVAGNPGYVWVRPIQAGGTFGPKERVRGPVIPMSMTPGKPVKLGVVEGELQVIGIDFASALAQGVNPTQDSVVDPNANNPMFVNQSMITTAYGQIVEGTLKIAIRGALPLIAGVFVKLEGQIDFTGNVPSSGNHCLAATAVQADGQTLEVQYSTAKSTQIPLDLSDVNEAWALMSSPTTNAPLWGWDIGNGQTSLVEANRWADLRQMINFIIASGGGAFYQTVQGNGSAIAQEPILDFINGTNTTVTVTDDGAGTRTKVKIDVTDTDYYQTLQKAAASATQRGKVNFLEGTNISIVLTDNSGNDSTDVTIGASDNVSSKDLFSATATANVANTSSETTLLGSGVGSLILGANTLAVGKGLEFEAWGIMSTLGALPGTLNIKFKLGSVVIVSTGAISLVAGLAAVLWKVRVVLVTVSTGASGTVRAEGKFSITNLLADTTEQMTNGTSTVTIDTTVTETVDLTATFGTASASNSITSTNALMRFIDITASSGAGIDELTGGVIAGPGSGSEVATLPAKFLIQTADSNLPNAQAMGALGTGLVKNTTTTGLQSIASAGTDYTSPTGTENLSNKTINTSDIGTTTPGSGYFSALRLKIGGFFAIFTHAFTANRTVTLPGDADVTLVGVATAQTLTGKTLTTPTIGDFTNANHDHSNAAGGGQITDAALSAAVGIPKGGTGQTTQTAAFDALDPLTAKGDIITNDGTHSVRQGVGTNNQVLTADSAQTNGIKWALVSLVNSITGLLGLANGGTHADLSATGGANQFVKQSSAGADLTVSAIASADIATALTTPGPIGGTTPAAIAGTTVNASSVLTTQAGRNRHERVVTAAGSVTVTSADDIITINKTVAAPTTVNLPASPAAGDIYTIKDGKGDSATNNITIDGISHNINGGVTNTIVLSANYGSMALIYNGATWDAFIAVVDLGSTNVSGILSAAHGGSGRSGFTGGALITAAVSGAALTAGIDPGVTDGYVPVVSAGAWDKTNSLDGAIIGTGTVAAARLGVMTGDASGGGAKGAVPAPATGDAIKAFFGDATFVGAGRKLVARTVLGASAANIDLTSIPTTYEMLLLIMELRSDRASNTVDSVYIRFNNDSTAANYYSYSIIDSGTTPTETAQERLGVTATGIEINQGASAATAAANERSYLVVQLYSYADSARQRHAIIHGMARHSTTTGTLYLYRALGDWTNTANAINRITILPVNGANWVAGSSYMLYGFS